MTNDEQDQLLYDAGKESIVAEETEASTYEKILKVAYEKPIEELIKMFKEAEKKIKAEFSLKSMPNPWRSAKSVVLNAMAKGMPLKDGNGNFKGKSRLQTDLKILASVASPTIEEYVKSIIMMLESPKHGFLQKEVQELFAHLYI
jgi:hypothetical protein